jgi:hypothetical protein
VPCEKVGETFGPKYAFGTLIEYQTVPASHRDRASLALGGAHLGPAGTGVITIAIELSRPQRHDRAASGANGNSGGQNGAGRNTRWRPSRIALGQECLNAVKHCPLNRRRRFHRHPFRPWRNFAGLRFLNVEPVGAGICLLSKCAVHIGNGELLAAELVVAGIQPGSNRLDPVLPCLGIALHIVDLPHDLGFGFQNG